MDYEKMTQDFRRKAALAEQNCKTTLERYGIQPLVWALEEAADAIEYLIAERGKMKNGEENQPMP